MRHARARRKARVAAEIGALCAFSAIKNNDRVGLILGTDVVEKLVPPKKGEKHVMRVIREILGYEPQLHRDQPQARARDAVQGRQAAERRLRRQRLLRDRASSARSRWPRRKHDVIPVMLVDPRDEELPDVGLATFEDCETGEEVVVDTGDARGARALQERRCARVRARAREALPASSRSTRRVVRTDESFVDADPRSLRQARAEDPAMRRG